MDFPAARLHRPVISSLGADAVGSVNGVAPGSATWPVANRAIFVPFVISAPYPVARLWWANGATASGNLDCGVYSQAGVLLASTGSTAQTGTTVVQSVAVPLLLLPGSYYMALVASATTTTLYRAAPLATTLSTVGLAQQSSALPLPATATLAAASSAFLPLFGIASAPVI